MYRIPDEFRDIPEANRLREAQAQFEAAIEEEKRLTQRTRERVHLISEQLRKAQGDVQQAQDAFDAVTGEPKPPGLTAAVTQEISRLFPPPEHNAVAEFIDRSCGRTIPFRRESTANELEYTRICVIRLSGGDFAKFRKEVEIANLDERAIIYSAASLMKDYDT